MGIYQLKFKGVEGLNAYEIFLSSSIEETVKQFKDCITERKKIWGDEYDEKVIERVLLLFDADDSKEVKDELINLMGETFRAVRDLGKLGWVSVEEKRFSVWELESLMNSLEERFDQIWSIISAYYDINENKRVFFGDEE